MKLDELKAAYAVVMDETNNLDPRDVGSSWEYYCRAERLAAAALLDALEKCLAFQEGSHEIGVDLVRDRDKRIAALESALACSECGGCGWRHDEWPSGQHLVCPVCGHIRESIRREPHA